MKVALFVERDGILNHDCMVGNKPVSPSSLAELAPKTDSIEPLRQAKAMGYLLIATTHQPKLSRGELDRRELDRMHDALRQIFCLDDICVCPHDVNDFCPCRKPEPGLITEAAFKWHISLAHSYVLGNKWQDAEAAHNAGCTSLLISSPWIGKGHHDAVLPNVAEAPRMIARLHAARNAPPAVENLRVKPSPAVR
ncbi:MAG: HAD hydrolase-like protein [Limisphaerales bacterium]